MVHLCELSAAWFYGKGHGLEQHATLTGRTSARLSRQVGLECGSCVDRTDRHVSHLRSSADCLTTLYGREMGGCALLISTATPSTTYPNLLPHTANGGINPSRLLSPLSYYQLSSAAPFSSSLLLSHAVVVPSLIHLNLQQAEPRRLRHRSVTTRTADYTAAADSQRGGRGLQSERLVGDKEERKEQAEDDIGRRSRGTK